MLYYPEDQQRIMTEHLISLSSDNALNIPFGIKPLDDVIDPLADGECGFVIGRPNHGKSVVLAHLCRQASLQYLAYPDVYAPPIFISAEMSIEGIMTRNLSNYTKIDSKTIRTGKGKNDWVSLFESSEKMIEAWPTIYVGASLNSGNNKAVTIDLIEDVYKQVCDKYGKKPRMVVIDYLQRLSMKSGPDEPRLLFNKITQRYKNLCMNNGTPGLMGSQANRDVESLPFPVPDARHAKESGEIEETGDYLISVMKPSKYWKVGSAIPRIQNKIIVTHDLFYINAIKRRDADSNIGRWVSMDGRISELAKYEQDYELKDS